MKHFLALPAEVGLVALHQLLRAGLPFSLALPRPPRSVVSCCVACENMILVEHRCDKSFWCGMRPAELQVGCKWRTAEYEERLN